MRSAGAVELRPARSRPGSPVELLCALHPPHPETGRGGGIGDPVPGCLAGLGAGTLVLLSIARDRKGQPAHWMPARNAPGRFYSTRANTRSPRRGCSWRRGADPASWPCSVERDEAGGTLAVGLEDPPMSRRDMFRLVAQQGKIAMARAMEKDRIAKEKNPGATG